MQIFYKIIFLLFGFSTIVSSNYLDDIPDCLIKTCTHLKSLPSKNRTKFYICNTNAPDFNLQPQNCPEGRWFNSRTQFCVEPPYWIDPCIPIVRDLFLTPECNVDKKNQLYPSKVKSEFLECKNSTFDPNFKEFHRVSCPQGKFFDWKNQNCIPEKDWSHPITNPPACFKITCEGDQVNKLHPAMHPSRYYECVLDDQNEIEAFKDVHIPRLNYCWDLLFDAQKRKCVKREDWNTACGKNLDCLNITCNKFQRNLFLPSMNFTEYFYCEPVDGSLTEFQPVSYECNHGYWFDYKMQECVSFDWYSPCDQSISTPSCILLTCNKDQRDLLFPSVNRNEYIHCRPPIVTDIPLYPYNDYNWQPKLFSCPNDLWFNFAKQICDSKENWQDPCIPEPDQKPENPMVPPSTRDCINITCNDDQLESKWPSVDPTLYLMCQPSKNNPDIWEPLEMKCPKNRWFNFDLQKCVEKSI